MADFLATPGNDVFNGSVAENDTVSYEGAEAAVSVSLSIGSAQTTGGSGIDTLISIENLIGTRFNDTLTGNTGNNIIVGGEGSDTLNGGDGNDTLSGGEGNDTLNGGRGNNVIDGGSGIDTATIDFSDRTGDVVLVNGAVQDVVYAATVGGQAAGSVTNVETLSSLFGGSGNDRLGGVVTGLGGDLRGGGGNDVLVLDASTLTNSTGAGAGLGFNDYDAMLTLGDNFQRFTWIAGFEGYEFTGTAGNDVFLVEQATLNSELSGGAGNDALVSGSGNDILSGGAGNDRLFGGDGIDTAYFSGLRENYTIVRNATTGVTTVVDNRFGSPDGTDTLTDIEYLVFEDTAFNPLPPAAANLPPVKVGAQSVLGDGFEDTPYTVTTLQLARGFADPNNDALFVSAISATNGSVSAVGNGNFRLNPNPNYNGPISFSYTLSDGRGGTIAANLDLTLRPVNDAPLLTGPAGILPQGRENVPYTFAGEILLAGYADLEGDAFALANVRADNATVVADGTGTVFVLTPNLDFNGTLRLIYDLVDAPGAVTTVVRFIEIAPANVAPVRFGAQDNLPATVEERPYVITAAQLLSGFTDQDGDLLSVQGLAASNATVTDNGNGSFTVLPNRDFNGAVTLSYQVSDGELAISATQSFEVLPETSVAIDTPESLRPGAVGTANVVYTENAPTSAAGLVLITGTGMLIADPLTGGFSQNVLVLAGADDPAATSDSFTVSVRMASAQGPASLTATTIDRDALIDWSSFGTALRPVGISDAAWDRASALLRAGIGESYGRFIDTLADNAARIGSFGMDSRSATAALNFEIEQACDFGTFEAREATGSLGEGWAFIGDIRLAARDQDSFVLSGLLEFSALLEPDIDILAGYTLSQSIDLGVALSGGTTAAPETSITFARQADGRFASSDGSVSLVPTATGFEVRTGTGDLLTFDANGRFQTIADGTGRSATASYTADGLIAGLAGLANRTLSFTRDGDGKVVAIADNFGETLTLHYDSAARLASVESDDGTTGFAYDANGDLVGIASAGLPDLSIAYDDFGRLISIETTEGGAETYAYDEQGGHSITNANGGITRIELAPNGEAARLTDASGLVSRLVFAEDGTLAGVRGPDGALTSFVLDDQGRVLSSTDGTGATIAFSYAGDSPLPATLTDAGGGTRGFTYNDAGQVTEAIWPDGTRLIFSYDANGRVTESVNRRGETTSYSYDANGNLTASSQTSAGPASYVYDAAGQLTAITTAAGTTSLTYEATGRIASISYPDGKSLTYTYDSAGRRTSMTDQDGNQTLYGYDAAGRLASVRNGDGDGVSYTYDGAGFLVREANSNGTATEYSYDPAGKVTAIVNLAPDGSVSSQYLYSYDAGGRRTGMATSDGDWTYGYDAAGQLTSATFLSSNPDISDKAIAYVYDAAGNRISSTEDGVTTGYTSNLLNQYETAGDASFTYDASGNMLTRTDASGTTSYSYDSTNRLTGYTTSSGDTAAFEFDAFGNRSAQVINGVRTEFLVDPFGFGNVVADYDGTGALQASYLHGLNLASRVAANGDAAFYDLDAVASVVALTGDDGAVANRYGYTPFGTEQFESEAIANRYEFNGGLGVAEEDVGGLHYMRARDYSADLGRFITEDTLWYSGDISNFNGFVLNQPTNLVDPLGLVASPPYQLPPLDINPVPQPITLDDIILAQPRISEEYITYIEYLDSALGIAAAATGLGGAVRQTGKLAIKFLDAPAGAASNKAFRELLENQFKKAKKAYDLGEEVGELVQRIKKNSEDLESDLDRDGIPDSRDDDIDGDGKRNEVDDDIDNDGKKNDVDDDDNGNGISDDEENGIKPLDDEDEASTQAEPSSSGNSNGVTFGDPHLVTFDGLGYSFQAVGEFTLVRGDDFEVQVRQKAAGASVSLNSAVALRSGDDVVAIYARANGPLVINGTIVELAVGDTLLIGAITVFRSAADTFQVVDDNGNGFTARYRGDFMNVGALIGDDANRNISGLLGNADGTADNDLVLTDGTVLPNPVAAQVLYGAYADSWRVTDATSLFTYGEGESTETFTDRSFPADVVTIDDLPDDVRAAAEAVALAAGLAPGTFAFEAAVLDIAQTGNPDFAELLGAAPPPMEPVPVIVQRPPVANDDVAMTDEDVAVIIDVLKNDSDPEDDDLQIVSASDPAGGSVVVTEDGKLLFTPKADFNGTTTLSYSITDSFGNFSNGQVRVDIAAVNDAPVAQPDAVSVDEGAGTANLAPLLLSNDDEVDAADTKQIVSVSTVGTIGQVVFDLATQSVRYFADADVQLALRQGESAADSFTYTIADAAGLISTATVTMTINGLDNDAVYGTPASDVLTGTDGDDVIEGLAGNDDLRGHDGNDELLGGVGADRLVGGSGNDIVNGGGDNDAMSGGAGDDLLIGGGGDDVINGAAGDDTAVYSGNRDDYTITVDRFGRIIVTDNISGRDGRDQVQGVENFVFNGEEFLASDLVTLRSGQFLL